MAVTSSSSQCDHATYRLIVFRRNRSEILLIPQASGFQLPSVEIFMWQRAAENLCTAVKQRWGCEAICLWALDGNLGNTRGDTNHYGVMECWRESRACTESAAWVPLSSIPAKSLDPEERLMIQQSSTSAAGKDRLSPFARPGWFEQLLKWACDVLRPLGFELSGPFKQFNASPSFSLLRFETSGPAVWFKAVGEPNRHEFGITLTLAKLFPAHLPAVIGTRPDWNGWLSFEAEGMNLADTREISVWEIVVASLARLQFHSLNNAKEITAAGARDLSVGTLLANLNPFFEMMSQLMAEQRKVPPPVLGKADLRLLAATIQESLTQLGELAMPDTLGHGDLNPGNIIVSPVNCAFLDWAEAYVGNPVFSFQYLLEHFRRSSPQDYVVPEKLKRAYVEQWQLPAACGALDEALHLSPLLAAFAHAVACSAWNDQDMLDDSATAGYLRSLTRRMRCEAQQLDQRRSTCLC